MKKTLTTSILALALASTASAADVFYNLSDIASGSSALSTSGKLQATMGEDGMVSIGLSSAGQASDFYTGATSDTADISICFALDLSQMWKDMLGLTTVNNKPVLNLDFSANDLGIHLTKSGTVDTFAVSPPGTVDHGNSRKNTTIISTSGTFTVDENGNPTDNTFVAEDYRNQTFLKDGHYYTVLTATVNEGGLKLYDMDGTLVYHDSGLMWGANRGVNGITVDTNYISDIVITPSVLTDATDIKNTAGLIPEPTTATLSLLALAGLAARRRRNG